MARNETCKIKKKFSKIKFIKLNGLKTHMTGHVFLGIARFYFEIFDSKEQLKAKTERRKPF